MELFPYDLIISRLFSGFCLLVCLFAVAILLVLVGGFGDTVSFNPRLASIFLSPSVSYTREQGYRNCAEAKE